MLMNEEKYSLSKNSESDVDERTPLLRKKYTHNMSCVLGKTEKIFDNMCPKCGSYTKTCNCKLREEWCDMCGYKIYTCSICGRVEVGMCPHYKGHPGPRIAKN
jgi:hypothetical protein